MRIRFESRSHTEPAGEVANLHIAYLSPICIIYFMVVRMRATRSHRNNRRSHHALTGARVSKCQDCGAQHRSHMICMNCGSYRGRKVIDVAGIAAAKAKKASAKAKSNA